MSQLHANYRLEFYIDVHEFKTIVFQEWRNETNEYFPPLCSLTRSQVFSKKNIFFLHLAFPAHVTVFSGAGLWKRVPEWRFVKTPEFRFHVDGRKRIFEYKMSYILQPRST